MTIKTKDIDIHNIMQAVAFALVNAREHKTNKFWDVHVDAWEEHLQDLARIKLSLKTGEEVVLQDGEAS